MHLYQASPSWGRSHPSPIPDNFTIYPQPPGTLEMERKGESKIEVQRSLSFLIPTLMERGKFKPWKYQITAFLTFGLPTGDHLLSGQVPFPFLPLKKCSQ